MATANVVYGPVVQRKTVRQYVDTEVLVEVNAPKKVYLTLTIKEAQLLADIGTLIGGSAASRRGTYEDIKEALLTTGIEGVIPDDLQGRYDNSIYFEEAK